MSKHYYYKPVPTDEDLARTNAKMSGWVEGYAQARCDVLRAAYEAASVLGVDRDRFAREFTKVFNAPRGPVE